MTSELTFDIGPISFYLHEREILFGALVVMECISLRNEGAVIVLEVRLNVNALAGTLDDIMNEMSRSIANTAEKCFCASSRSRIRSRSSRDCRG